VLDLDGEVEATFVAGTHGRDGALALWCPPPAVWSGATGRTIELVLPADGGVALRSVPARLVPVAAAIGPLAALPADAPVRPSVRAWSAATRMALDLVARGRILPTIAADDIDTWRVGPLAPADHERLAALADALPAAAHAVPVAPTDPLRIEAPQRSLATWIDAVADALVRTAAAPVDAGHEVFADVAPHDVSAQRDWLRSTIAGEGAAIDAALRLELPLDEGGTAAAVLEVRSRLDPGLVVAAADLWTAPVAVLDRFGRDADAALLVTLRRAARVWPPVHRLLADARPDRLELDDDELADLFGTVTEDLAAAGLTVLWPVDVLRSVEVRPVVRTDRPAAAARGGLTLAAVAELRWRASIAGEDLTDGELALLAEAKRPMVRLRGKWVRADVDELRRLGERRRIRIGDVLAAAITGTLVVDGDPVEAEIEGPLVDLAARLLATNGPPPAVAPAGLRATLRPYQERGVAWLAEMADLGLGGVLADDMGLGKTIQVLALHLHRRGRGPTLVVCPATLLGNWEREAARFAPGVAVRRHHGAVRDLGDLADDEIVVATYGVVRRDVALLAEIPWDLVVADEAQTVKNPKSRTARALREIPAAARIALTGTPVENHLVDLWALLDWTTPGLLGPLDGFRRHVAVPIERERDPDVTERFASLVRPFLLRRRKADPDIAPDLPPKTETDRFVGLTVEQASLYRAVVAELLDEVATADGMQRRGLVLKLITALKQICNHPAHYLGQTAPLEGRSGKLDTASDLLGVIVDEGDSALVFTQYVAMGRLLTAHLGGLGIPTAFLHGSVPVAQRQDLVDAFQAGEPRVFVVSLKAGGTGLNLTRATHVIHYDRWWNPAVEDQASDRTWRIGQDRPVQVHRLICEGTLEERIAALLETKRSLADAVVGGGEAWLSELSDDALTELVRLGGGG